MARVGTRDVIAERGDAIDPDAAVAGIDARVASPTAAAAASSLGSHRDLDTSERVGDTRHGRDRLDGRRDTAGPFGETKPSVEVGKATLHNADCFAWLAAQAPRSIHAVVTDPPYGLVEYTATEKAKLRAGRGGVWRIPPSFDGRRRAPLPRFTVLSDEDRRELDAFFRHLGVLLARVTVPGANVVVASNPLLAHIVAQAMSEAGLELRGYIARQVMTMRGGDRPKNAHREFDGVSVMPRSQWEPWVVLRAPLQGRVQDNLRTWGTGGFRRLSRERPFGDLVRSHPTPARERRIAPHPSLKPQGFMRQIVRAVLPLGRGVVLDPFMGAGSTLAAANAVGYASVGLELDEHFFDLAVTAVPRLAALAEPDGETRP